MSKQPPKLQPIPGAPGSAPNPDFLKFRVISGVLNTDSVPGEKAETEKPEVPTLQELVREGRASAARGKRGTQAALIEALDQVERLWISRTHYGLGGDQYVAFAASILISRSDAFEMVKLHAHRQAVLARVFAEDEAAKAKGIGYYYPGWKICLGWFKPKKSGTTKRKDRDESAVEEIRKLEEANHQLEGRLAAAEQQVRSERIAKEEAQEQITRLTAELDALRTDYNYLVAHQCPAWEDPFTENEIASGPEPEAELQSQSENHMPRPELACEPEHEPGSSIVPFASPKQKSKPKRGRGRPRGSKNKPKSPA